MIVNMSVHNINDNLLYKELLESVVTRSIYIYLRKRFSFDRCV